MGQAADRDGAAVVVVVDDVFDHPAFASLKSRASAFVAVLPESRDLIWANAAAAAYWDRSADTLGTALFGPPGRGWLGMSLSAVVPGRSPQMFRTGLAPGLGMRGSMVLARAIAGPDGTTIVGFAVPGSGTDGAAADAWRGAARPDTTTSTGSGAESREPPPLAAAAQMAGEAQDDPAAGASLSRRSQLAVLRDRLVAATDGATILRLLWRTDARGILTQMDERLSQRLGAPLTAGSGPLPEAVARFDAAAGEQLGLAFAARATWSGIALRLPVAGGAALVPTLLSGSPVFGRDRGFEGYRGFGIVDLGGLETKPREKATPVAAGPSPAAEPLPTTSAEPHPVGPSPETPPVEMRDPAALIDPEPEGAGPPRLPRVSDFGLPLPGTEQEPFANVVELRSFQGVRSAPPVFHEPETSAPENPEPEIPVLGPILAGSDSREAEGPADEPFSDEMAFQALGAALRARIGDDAPVAHADTHSDPHPQESAPPERAKPVSTPAAPVHPAAAAAAPLLDRLPIPVVVLRDGAPAFANVAAIRALGFDTPGDLVGVEPRPAADGVPSGLTLRNGRGEPIAVAAEPTPVDWNGRAATLWMFGPGAAEARPPAEAPIPPPRPDADERPIDLIDRVDDAVALLDGEGRIRRLNERGRNWFGEHSLGENVTTLLAPESRTSALQLLEEAGLRPEGSAAAPPRREVMARTVEGTALPALLTLGRLGAAGFYATLRDVSALRRAEHDEARSRGDRERDAGRLPDLLARVSHEIRTPLNAILGFAEVMMDERFGPLGNARYRDYLKDIHASGTQVVTLVGDLLDLSRIEAGRLDLDVGALDVNRIVAEIVAQMQSEANRGRVIVRTSLASRIPSVLVDERSARQIVQHLLSNAVKFNEPGGQVIVSTAQDDGGAVLLRIRDTGVGMTEAEIAAALEPFHDVSPPRPANGNGLGLPLARALVGANGASLSIRSRPREGTLVEVSFPAAPPEEARRGA